MRQSRKRKLRNMHTKSTMRSAIKDAERATESKQTAEARELTKKAIPLIDKAASKGVIHKNKAARHVSRITRKLNALLAGAQP